VPPCSPSPARRWNKDRLFDAYMSDPRKVQKDAGVSGWVWMAHALRAGSLWHVHVARFSLTSPPRCPLADHAPGRLHACGCPLHVHHLSRGLPRIGGIRAGVQVSTRCCRRRTHARTALREQNARGHLTPRLPLRRHLFCRACWAGYLTAAVKDTGQACIYAKCPADGCGEAVTYSVVSAMAPGHVAETWRRFELQQFVNISKVSGAGGGGACCGDSLATCTHTAHAPSRAEHGLVPRQWLQQCLCRPRPRAHGGVLVRHKVLLQVLQGGPRARLLLTGA